MNSRDFAEYFRKLRFDPNHHLGLGDIRLTLGQQEELVALMRAEEQGAFCPMDSYCKETPLCPWPCKKLKAQSAAPSANVKEGK
jgi:hypothetical protein